MNTAVWLVTVLVATGLLSGCGGQSSNGASNAQKLASLDKGSMANDAERAAYQHDLDAIGTYCKQTEDQLTRMIYAASTTLTDNGAPTSARGFMHSFLTAYSGVTPTGREDCTGDFALVMGALRADGGAG